jgi:hypothetical protein
MALDFMDIWIPHIRYTEMLKSAASVRISSAAMNCQRAKRVLQTAVAVSSQGCAGWHLVATSRMEIRAQAMLVPSVLQIAIEWPVPGVRRRKRKAVESLEKKRVVM